MEKKRMERLCQEIGRGVKIIPGESEETWLIGKEEK
jgi:hypothetical protein